VAVSASDIAFVEELFAPLGEITHRKMMGGLSIYLDGQIFSILSSDGTVFLKARGAFAKTLQGEGCLQFGAGAGPDMGKTMGYWTLPEAALEDAELASDWARRALAALRGATKQAIGDRTVCV